MFSLDELQAMSEDNRIANLMPADRAVNYLPRLAVSSFEANELYMGKIINQPIENNIIGLLRLYENDDKFIGLGELQESGLLKVKRLLTRPS
jgi:tRNA pseudouridine55 synthase